MVLTRTFRLTLTALAVLAMLLGTGFGASATCGPGGTADSSPVDVGPDSPVSHSEHSAMAAVQMDMTGADMAEGTMACDMCVGDGACDHGVCTPGIAAHASLNSSRVTGGHEIAGLPGMVSLSRADQPPPPRTVS